MDDGPGLPADFKLDDGKGLGMRIIRALVNEINGELLIVRGEHERRLHLAEGSPCVSAQALFRCARDKEEAL